jgi:hypothetical protein
MSPQGWSDNSNKSALFTYFIRWVVAHYFCLRKTIAATRSKIPLGVNHRYCTNEILMIATEYLILTTEFNQSSLINFSPSQVIPIPKQIYMRHIELLKSPDAPPVRSSSLLIWTSLVLRTPSPSNFVPRCTRVLLAPQTLELWFTYTS